MSALGHIYGHQFQALLLDTETPTTMSPPLLLERKMATTLTLTAFVTLLCNRVL